MNRNRILLPVAMCLISLLGIREAAAQSTCPSWCLAGNSTATFSSRLGTTNLVPVRIVTNNTERMRIHENGNVGIGTATPAYKLDVYRNDGNILMARFNNAATVGDRTSLIDIQNGNGVLWRYGVGGTGNGLGLNTGQFYIERAGIGSVLNINTAGSVGIGTTAPAARLEVSRKDGNYLLAKYSNLSTTGDRTALVDIQNGNGVLWRYGVGGTGNGLGISSGQFYIEKAGSGAKLTIDATGNMGIGTSSPGVFKTKIVHGTFGLDLENSATGHDWELRTNSSTTAPNLDLYLNGSFKGSFSHGSGAYMAISDERLKTNIKAMPSVLEKVNQLKPATYRFGKANGAEAQTSDAGTSDSYGFLAQDVLKIFPHLVSHNTDKERGEDTYSMDYSGFGVIAIKAVQELQKSMQEQEQKMEKQQRQNDDLQKQVDELKALVNKSVNGGNTNGTNTKVFLSSARLDMISPNPVKGTAGISYSIPRGVNKAQLVITDGSGRTVRTVQLDASGMVQMDVSTLSSGVYNCSLVVDDNIIQTRKMAVAQ